MTIRLAIRRPIKRHIRRPVRRAVDLRDYFANDEEGFLGSSAFANLYATYLQAANITAYGDATGFVKNTLPATDKFLILNGASTTYASTPDAAALDITGDIDLRAYVVLRDWTPAVEQALIAKWTTSANFSYVFGVTNATGTLRFAYSDTGAAGGIKLSTSSVAPAGVDGEGLWVRVTYAAATGKVNYYTATEGPTETPTWTLLGTEQTITAGNIFAGSGILRVGSYDSGVGFAGKIYNAQVYNGINGTKVFDLTPNSYVSGSTYTCGTGQTVTLQGTAIIVPNELQFYQQVSASRPAASSWPKTGIFNFLASTTAQSEGTTGWTGSAVTPVAGADGILASLTETTANATHIFFPTTTTSTSGVTYTAFYVLRSATEQYMQITPSATRFSLNDWVNYDLTNTILGSKGSAGVGDIRAVPASWVATNPELAGAKIVMLQATCISTGAGSVMSLYFTNNSDATGRAPSYVGDTNSICYASRAMWVVGARDIDWYIANYQKVTSADLVEQTGAPNVSGVRGDGTDDFLNSGITAIDDSHFFAAAGQGCCIAIPLVMLPGFSGTIFAKCGATDANKQLHARVGTDGLLDIFVRGTEGANLETVADGLPHYLIYNQDGATATYMFDGMTETALTVGAAAEEILETFMLFARTIGTPALFGRYRLGLDELVVVSRSLTLAERQQLMLNAANNFGVTLS